jgi:hypothetical protein
MAPTTAAPWRARADARLLESTIRDEAEAVGLAPDAIVDRVTYVPPTTEQFGLSDATRRGIRAEVRALALAHPEHVRDPAALKLSPSEAVAHYMALVEAGEKQKAQAFQARYPAAVEAGRVAAAREMSAGIAAEQQREHRIGRLQAQLAQENALVAQDSNMLRVQQETGYWPGGAAGYGRAEAPGPHHVQAVRDRLLQRQAVVTRLEQELATVNAQ